jgi:hypothetical protein
MSKLQQFKKTMVKCAGFSAIFAVTLKIVVPGIFRIDIFTPIY